MLLFLIRAFIVTSCSLPAFEVKGLAHEIEARVLVLQHGRLLGGHPIVGPVLGEAYKPVNLYGCLLLPIAVFALNLRPNWLCMEYGGLGRRREYDLRLRAGTDVNDFTVAWRRRSQAQSEVKRVALDG